MDSTEELETDAKAITSRAYQIEMFEQSMHQNVIVAMETGSGKTQIAKLRIEAELERSPAKRIWFCAPSVVLAQQQYRFLSTQLPTCQARLLTGLDNVQLWSTQQIWDIVLDKINLIVSTPQVLLDALSNAFVSLQQFSLIVFDEAHHCMSNAPMALIMSRFYQPFIKEHRTIHTPHVLGLTASPITNKPSMLSKLESNMCAVCVTPTLQVENYKQYVYMPVLERLEFTPSAHEPAEIVKRLEKVVSSLTIADDPTVNDLRANSESILLQQKLDKIMEKGQSPIMKQMRSFLGHAEHIHDNVGAWAADLYVRACATKLHEALALHEILLPTLADKEQRYIDSKLQPILSSMPSLEFTIPAGTLIAPKAAAVVEYLSKVYEPGVTVIIFVKRRSAVFALTQMLQRCPQMQDYGVFSFVGTANAQKRGLVDLADMQLQNEGFTQFQAGQRNICIGTQVMEEGVDVQATNIVIRFDEPENFRSFIQSRGRARRPDSRFVTVHPAEDSQSIEKLRNWKELEEVMKEQYSDSTRNASWKEGVEEEYEEGDEVYRVAETGALLSYDNARQHLDHFCSSLPWENDHQPARPIFIVSDSTDGMKEAHVILPSSISSPLQMTNSLRTWRTERMAKKDAAFQTYRRLHLARFVNDNLLPFPRVRKDNVKLEKRDSIYQVRGILDPWMYLAANFDPMFYTHRHRITVSGSKFSHPTLLLLLPLQIGCTLSFTLHSDIDGTIEVSISSEGSTLATPTDIAHDVTTYLFKAILGRRLKRVDMANQLPYLILPDVALANASAWFDKVKETVPLLEMTFNSAMEQRFYLLKHKNMEILYLWEPDFKDNQPVRRYLADETIIAERLSKQLSYLASGQNSSEKSQREVPDVRLLDVGDCAIQGLPAAYGSLMLLMPSISYMLALALRGQLAIESGPLSTIGFSNSELVGKSLVSSSASAKYNFESLEFVGDSLLKYYASVQVFFDHPDLTEGVLTRKYAAIASNARLQRATKEVGLDAYITTEPFSGQKWTLDISKEDPPQRDMSSKTLADVVEALVGAAFLDAANGPTQDELPLSALSVFLPEVTWKSPAAHIQTYLRQSSLSKASIANLDKVENMLGYQFEHKMLLLEAMTRTTQRAGFQSFQRLEFLGDAVLDCIINVALYNSGFGLDPEHLKYRRDALVNRWILAFLAMEAHHTVVTNEVKTSLSGETTISPVPKIIRLIDYMKTLMDRAEQQQRQKAESSFLQNRDTILTALGTSKTFPWLLLHAIDTSKSYSDIIESTLAAVFIDSGGSLAACERVLDSLGLFKVLKRLTTEQDIDARQPVVVLKLKDPTILIRGRDSGRLSDGSRKWTCSVSMESGEVVAEASSGVSEKHAEALAATMTLERINAKVDADAGTMSDGGVAVDVAIAIAVDVDAGVDTGSKMSSKESPSEVSTSE